ncbi:hypothetical protein [Lutibacter sp. B1]|uniref:hypothetical protein n=1 Tax=Lutibacter sp. B1 TaxID=2725996 RepID=UPI001457416B|nr:hypothetical protein [Lutibacter sp. B1]NLP59410.1 hypothetical protein [Lutibacter sp. B1]
MKRKLTIFLMFLIGNIIYSQNLTLTQVLSVRKKNIAEAEEYLTQKNWSMINAEAPTSETYGSLTFAYNKSDFNDKAESFLWFYYSNENPERNRISVQIHKKEKYNEYINQIKKWGGKIYDSYVEEKVFYKIYQGSTMTYIIDSSTQKDDFSSSKTIYGIFIMTNDSFRFSRYNKK